MKYKAVLFDMDGIIFNEPIGVILYICKRQEYDMLREVSLKTLEQAAKRSMEIIQLSYLILMRINFRKITTIIWILLQKIYLLCHLLETINLVHEKNLCGLCSSNSKHALCITSKLVIC